MGHLTVEAKVALDNYKYQSGDYSWLDNKMNPFWVKMADMLPLWMAPNMVTFIGFLFMCSSYACFLFYDVSM